MTRKHIEIPFGERCLALFALTGFALAQPLFDLFGKTPEFFVIRRSSGLEIFGLMLVLLFGIPALCIVAELIIGIFHRKARIFVHLTSVSLLSSAIALPIISKLIGADETRDMMFVLIACALGIVVSVVYAFKTSTRAICRYLAVGVCFFAAFFVYTLISQGLIGEGPLGVARQTDKAKPAPVFMIIFDEFPLFSLLNENKEINEARFAGFADLARYSNWFRNGTSVSSWTERAVPTILSGLYPDENKKQLPSFQHYPQNIFTLLSDTHAVKGFEQVTHLCPDSICKNASERDTFLERFQTLLEDSAVVYLHFLLPEGMKKSLPDISYQWGGFLDVAQSAKPVKKSKKGLLDKGEWSDDRWLFNEFIKSIRNDVPNLKAQGKVPFYMVHITFPHVPYRFLPDGNRYLLDLERTNDVGYKKMWAKSDKWPATVGLQRFILQAGFADSMVRDLLSVVRETGIFDESIIVVTADHGSSFMPGEFSRRVSDKNYMDVMLVPYFLKLPGQISGTLSERNVETIDIVPSILQAQGLVSPQPFDGVSVFDTQTPERQAKTFFPLEKKKPKMTFSKVISVEPSLSKSIEIFGNGGFDDRFFHAAPESVDLIGKPLSTVVSKRDPALTINFDAKPDYKQINRSSGYLPVYLSGFLTPTNNTQSLKDGSAYIIIVGVDGVIRGITQSEESDKGKAKFSVILPPNALNDGSHTVEALVIK